MNIHPLGAESLHAEGEPDVTKLRVIYRNFSNAPLNVERCSFLWSFAQMTGTRNE